MYCVNRLAFFGGLIACLFLFGFIFLDVSGRGAVPEIFALAVRAVNICVRAPFMHFIMVFWQTEPLWYFVLAIVQRP